MSLQPGSIQYRLVRKVAHSVYPYGVAPWCVSSLTTSSTTLQQLGFASGTRLLIINADDFGLCDDVNEAIITALESGIVTSTSVMVPCPGFPRAAAFARSNPAADIGIHLTLTSEWAAYRWRPVLGAERVPSLVDSDGYFWSTAADVFAHARLDEIEAELRAQINKALGAGINVTHLDSHMFVLQSKRSDYYRVYRKLAHDYLLSFRAIRRTVLKWFTRVTMDPMRARRVGVSSPDHLIFAGWRDPNVAFDYWNSILTKLPPGVTEVYCHPGFARTQLRQLAEDADQRQADFDFFTSDAARRLLDSENVRLITHRELGDLMQGFTSLS